MSEKETKKNMLISVNICLYNSVEFIKETLDSVFAQTYENFEVVAVDDGSTDGTYEFIKKNYSDPRLRLYRQKNHGLSYTRNRCAELSAGSYLAFLDHDDIWMPEKLNKQVVAIKRTNHPPSLVFCDHQVIDKTGALGSVYSIEKERTLLDSFFDTALNERACIIGLSGVMLQKKMWDSGIARFDERYKMAEEYDVWMKASMENSAYAYVPEILFHYRVHGENTSIRMPELVYLESIDILYKLLNRASHRYRSMIKKNIAQFCLEFFQECPNKSPEIIHNLFAYIKMDVYVFWWIAMLYLTKFLRGHGFRPRYWVRTARSYFSSLRQKQK
ncbi:MAG: glycosyltransferase [Victivallaceae bacterium]|nr:glycosyltransferase [Victivallaceae bacterium]